MNSTSRLTHQPETVEEAVDLYEARLHEFQHVFGRWQRDARARHSEVPHVATRAENKAKGSWSARLAYARRALLVAEQYLATYDLSADYETPCGVTARVVGTTGQCLRVIKDEVSR